MKIENVTIKKTRQTMSVRDAYVDKGLVEGGHSALPDIDSDFASDRRQEIKEYLEQRYNVGGAQRVFSAGTFSSLKLKAVLKDVARVHRVPHSLVNYITAIFDDNMDWTGLFKLAAVNRKVNRFVQDYPQVIEDIRTLMGQPRAASIHASAIIVTPDNRDGRPAECFDFLPIRKMDGLLVSEFDGYSVDEIGLLKEDVLATKELSKLSAVIGIVNRTYGKQYTIEHITQKELTDEKTYRLLAEGYTQNVFQFASRGITRFIMDVRPDRIEDLIVINALYRPATLDVGATEDYVRYKRGEVAPVYNFGTYDATKNTYGLQVYQEQFMSIAHTLGGFDLGKTDILRKAIGKKKADLMASLKDDFIAGAIANGCPEYEAQEIWHKIETAGGYSFNRCISGKEKIHRPSCGRWHPTIGEMYRLMNDPAYAKATNHTHLRNKYLRNGFGIAFSLNEDERLVKNRIVDIRYEGVKSLYRITLEDGKTIEVTANHKHPTQRGKVRTDELVAGRDQLFVNNGYGNTELATVKSIEYIGEQEVYDVEMAAPYHSFVTGNGVVTCNSHAAAYALTAYCGAWLKTNYPTAFYTVALQWADDKEIPALMAEMEECSRARIVPPDINLSQAEFFTDYTTDEIYWSLTRIKMVGVKTVEYIVRERERGGKFTSVENFIHRIFRYKLKKYAYWDDPDNADEAVKVPVNARHVRHLALSGCFDKIEGVKAVTERHGLLQRAARELGFALDEKEFPAELTAKHYFWSMQQIATSGIGSIDYRRIYDNSEAKAAIKGKAAYLSLREVMDPDNEGRRAAVCATVTETAEIGYTDKTTGERKKFCKLTLQQNNDLLEAVLWSDFYEAHRAEVTALKGRVVILTAGIKYSDFSGCNTLNSYKTSLLFTV
ncbi:DNA polymerase III subunit alpha [Alistipes indistinctus]|uniref:helix-hairpin-helix domain-containing protein n=1 Tax=Alistipes indistinctus TaxID=626932 RepID=UPI003A87A308